MTNYCKENTGMVIHTDSFANERRFVCILKCRRTRQTRVVLGWMLLRCLKVNCPWVTDMWASHLLGPHVMDTKAGALRHRSIVLSGWSRVSDGRVAPSHPPPSLAPPSPPKKNKGMTYSFSITGCIRNLIFGGAFHAWFKTSCLCFLASGSFSFFCQ